MKRIMTSSPPIKIPPQPRIWTMSSERKDIPIEISAVTDRSRGCPATGSPFGITIIVNPSFLPYTKFTAKMYFFIKIRFLPYDIR